MNIFDGMKQGVDESIIKENIYEVFKKRRSSFLILPSVCRQVLDLVQTTEGCFLAGGAALELYTGDIHKIKDWDIFSSNINVAIEIRSKLQSLGFHLTKNTEWGITLEKSKVIVQIITKHYPKNLKKLFNKFDFYVCCFAVSGNDLCYTKQSKKDVENKELNFIYTENIITTIKRLSRYGQKGYMPTTECVKKILKQSDIIPKDGRVSS